MQHILFFVMCSLPIQTFYPHQHSTVAIVLWNFLVHMNFPCTYWYFNGQGQLYSIQTHCTRLKALKGVFIFTIHSLRHRSYLSSPNTNTHTNDITCAFTFSHCDLSVETLFKSWTQMVVVGKILHWNSLKGDVFFSRSFVAVVDVL